MRLLVLGGTVFLGRHIVEIAVQRGHEVTLFHRGQRGAELFPTLERLHGNRDGDLNALQGRSWDAVIDTSGYVPRVVGASAQLLANAAEHYTFISTCSVYADMTQPVIDEASAVERLEDETTEEVQKHYGGLKVLCELAVEAAFPGRALFLRPGLIVGPYDPTDRFTYWPTRITRGGEVLAPGDPDRKVQIIDARDLAAFTLDLAERRQTGLYNTVGPAGNLTMGAMLAQCKAALQSDATFTWVAEPFLKEHNVGPWMEMPLWIPADGPAGLLRVSNDRAVAAGLTFRSVSETARDTVQWDATRDPAAKRGAGMASDREQELLAAWRGR